MRLALVGPHTGTRITPLQSKSALNSVLVVPMPGLCFRGGYTVSLRVGSSSVMFFAITMRRCIFSIPPYWKCWP